MIPLTVREYGYHLSDEVLSDIMDALEFTSVLPRVIAREKVCHFPTEVAVELYELEGEVYARAFSNDVCVTDQLDAIDSFSFIVDRVRYVIHLL